MVAVTQPLMGVDTEKVYANEEFHLGTTVQTENGGLYVFGLAGSAIAANFAVVIDEAFEANEVDTDNDDLGDIVGIPDIALASGEYGWFCRKGVHDLQVAASAAANTQLNTTSTAGQLDDAVAGANVNGIVLTTARGGSAGTAPAMLNYPEIGAAAA